MPSKHKKVRFETEYNSSFKAFDLDSYKSPLIEAILPKSSVEDVTSDGKAAGLESQKFLKPAEPPFQHKRPLPNVNQVKSGLDKTYIVTKDKNEINTKDKFVKRNKALEFKAGLKPETAPETRKHPVSEYQREFEWKKHVSDDSPLLNAEKIVFDSHTNIPRFVRDKVKHKTEYQSKFEAGKRKVREKKQKENIEEGDDDEEETPSSTVKRLLQTSQNPDIPFFPHGSNRISHSEYQANFGSPKNYKYKEGIWLGAKPPHLLPDEESSRGSNGPITNWFEEVLELREKARQYKSRALEGNYFSRDFLAKLDGELENIDLQNLEETKRSKINEKHEDKTSKRSDNTVSSRPIKYAWGNIKNDKSTSTNDLNKQVRSDMESGTSDSDTISSVSDTKSKPSHAGTVSDQEDFGKTYDKRPKYEPLQFTKPNLSKSPESEESPKQNYTHEATSGSEASSEVSDHGVDFKQNSRSKHCRTTKYDIDKFDINTVRRIQSNDDDLLGSSVRSIDGSNSGCLTKSDLDSNCSASSYLSSESLARQTLSRAAKRDAQFWKKSNKK